MRYKRPPTACRIVRFRQMCLSTVRASVLQNLNTLFIPSVISRKKSRPSLTPIAGRRTGSTHADSAWPAGLASFTRALVRPRIAFRPLPGPRKHLDRVERDAYRRFKLEHSIAVHQSTALRGDKTPRRSSPSIVSGSIHAPVHVLSNLHIPGDRCTRSDPFG